MLTLNEVRDWLTFATAAISASVAIAVLVRQIRRDAIDADNAWSLEIIQARAGEPVWLKLLYRAPERPCFVQSIEAIAPEGSRFAHRPTRDGTPPEGWSRVLVINQRTDRAVAMPLRTGAGLDIQKKDYWSITFLAEPIVSSSADIRFTALLRAELAASSRRPIRLTVKTQQMLVQAKSPTSVT